MLARPSPPIGPKAQLAPKKFRRERVSVISINILLNFILCMWSKVTAEIIATVGYNGTIKRSCLKTDPKVRKKNGMTSASTKKRYFLQNRKHRKNPIQKSIKKNTVC